MLLKINSVFFNQLYYAPEYVLEYPLELYRRTPLPPPISTSRAGSTILCSGVCSGVSSGTIQEDSANPSSSKPGNKDSKVNISPEIQGVPLNMGIQGRLRDCLC